MLKFLSVLLLYVANGATLPIQTNFDNSDQPRFPRFPANSAHQSAHQSPSPLPQTHIRITRPPFDANLAASQASSHNIQFASSPTSDYYGGSVYSDGNGILVRPQADDISYQYHLQQPEISYFPSYRTYQDPMHAYGNPNSRYYEPMLPADNGLHYYATQPMQSRDVLMHGLGRVLPVNRNLRKPRDKVSSSVHDNDVLMFTLGRIMGQLNNMNNETNKMGPFLEYVLGVQQPQEKPKYPWGNNWSPPNPLLQSMLWAQTQTRPTNMWTNPIWARPAYPTMPYASTPRWWQPSYTPWQPDRPWWANIFEQEEEQAKPWWYELLTNLKQPTEDTDLSGG